jgi:Adenylate and Guanylate cyclase catalytic domain
MFEVARYFLWHPAGVSAGPPTGVVTFLFTDIEGSTRRWEAGAQMMRAALAAHDQVLRTAIQAHGGCLFKHTGDGVCASFASPRSAVDAAVTAQRELELPVRMGLATGEAKLRDGDYFGTVLNRAARVMAADVAVIGIPLANLAVLLDRLGRYDSAATILGFAYGPMTAVTIPELTVAIARLREVLSDGTYDSLARKGEAMTTAAMAAYAYDQIDQARAELEQER